MTGASVLNRCRPLVETMTSPRIETPVETITSVDHLARAHCMIIAPTIAPAPKHPSKIP